MIRMVERQLFPPSCHVAVFLQLQIPLALLFMADCSIRASFSIDIGCRRRGRAPENAEELLRDGYDTLAGKGEAEEVTAASSPGRRG